MGVDFLGATSDFRGCSSPPVRLGTLEATQIIIAYSSLVHSLLRQRQGYLRTAARLSQCRCAFGHALWSIFKARRAILLLGVHSLDSKTMRDELPCEIYACECLPITFFCGKRPPGAVWALALRRGYITIWVDFGARSSGFALVPYSQYH